MRHDRSLLFFFFFLLLEKPSGPKGRAAQTNTTTDVSQLAQNIDEDLSVSTKAGDDNLDE
jgi:hypothetical protein